MVLLVQIHGRNYYYKGRQMDAIIELFKQDVSSLILGIFIFMSAIIAIYEIACKFLSIFGKPIGIMKERKIDHELLLKTSENLAELQKKHQEDNKQSIEHSRKIQNELSVFMKEMKDSVVTTQNEIKNIVETNSSRDNQIDSLMVAQREIMGDRINQKYKYYLKINGIPADEVDEFTNLHIAYKGCGGNHSGDAKYEYCMNHLPIIPVETKLVIDKKN